MKRAILVVVMLAALTTPSHAFLFGGRGSAVVTNALLINTGSAFLINTGSKLLIQ